MAELKACPFCGTTPDGVVDATKILGVHRIVHRCKVIPPFSVEAATAEKVIEIWNIRHFCDAKLEAELTELNGLLATGANGRTLVAEAKLQKAREALKQAAAYISSPLRMSNDADEAKRRAGIVEDIEAALSQIKESDND